MSGKIFRDITYQAINKQTDFSYDRSQPMGCNLKTSTDMRENGFICVWLTSQARESAVRIFR